MGGASLVFSFKFAIYSPRFVCDCMGINRSNQNGWLGSWLDLLHIGQPTAHRLQCNHKQINPTACNSMNSHFNRMILEIIANKKYQTPTFLEGLLIFLNY